MIFAIIPERSRVHKWVKHHPWLASLFGIGVLLWWSVWI